MCASPTPLSSISLILATSRRRMLSRLVFGLTLVALGVMTQRFLIQSGNSPRWLPQVEGEMQCSSKFPVAKILRLSIEPVGLQEIQVDVMTLDVDLRTQQVTLLPTSTEELSI